MILIGIAAVIMAVIVAFWITKSITKPLSIAVDAAEHIAKGELTLHYCRFQGRDRYIACCYADGC